MIPVDQVDFGEHTGDCVRACIASVFELDLETVPNFWYSTQETLEFWDMFNDWVEENIGYRIVVVVFRKDHLHYINNVLCIAAAKSPRGGPGHAVVWRNGRVVHDPHPDRTGLAGDPEEYVLFVPLTPKREWSMRNV